MKEVTCIVVGGGYTGINAVKAIRKAEPKQGGISLTGLESAASIREVWRANNSMQTYDMDMSNLKLLAPIQCQSW
ncbi:NADH dehydrogenase [Brevibacillus laterosporus]|nr:NADH dehydrogenase [Brevibacillus laterosporus]